MCRNFESFLRRNFILINVAIRRRHFDFVTSRTCRGFRLRIRSDKTFKTKEMRDKAEICRGTYRILYVAHGIILTAKTSNK